MTEVLRPHAHRHGPVIPLSTSGRLLQSLYFGKRYGRTSPYPSKNETRSPWPKAGLVRLRDAGADCRRLGSRGLRAAALILVLVCWFFGAHPSLAAVSPEINAETKTSLASLAVFVPISDPAEAIVINARSPAHSRGRYWNVGFDFCPQFLSAQYFREGLDDRTLDINGEIGTRNNLPSHLDIFGNGFANIKSEQRSTKEIFFGLHALGQRQVPPQFGGMNSDFRPVCGNKFFARELDVLAAQSRLFVCGNPKSESETGHCDSSEGREKPVVLINQSQRTGRPRSDGSDELGLVIGVFGGIFGALLMYTGLKRVCELVFGPNKQAQEHRACRQKYCRVS